MFTTVYVNNECIYFNKKFWMSDVRTIYENYKDYSVKDIFNNDVKADKFEVEYLELRYKIELIKTIADQVQYNIDVGKEFIALFREEFVRTPLKEMTSLDIAQKTANLIPLILTGSFREACDLLRLYEPDEFMTRERIDKYIAMLTSADAITYENELEELDGYYSKNIGNEETSNNIEPSEPLEPEENQNKPETI